MKPSFAIIGCGRVGTALAKYLAKSGYVSAGLASKSLASAKRVADLLGAFGFSNVLWEAAKKADIVFITTPDGAIKSACDNISEKNGFKSGSVVLHCSGALSSNRINIRKNLRGIYRINASPAKLCLNRIRIQSVFRHSNIRRRRQGSRRSSKTCYRGPWLTLRYHKN